MVQKAAATVVRPGSPPWKDMKSNIANIIKGMTGHKRNRSRYGTIIGMMQNWSSPLAPLIQA